MDATKWLIEQTKGKRWKGFYVSAVADNGVLFSDVASTQDEAHTLATQLADEGYTDIQVWDKNCNCSQILT